MSDVILTSDHLSAWNDEIAKQAAVMAKAQAKIDDLKAKLNLVASLTGKKVKILGPSDGVATAVPATRGRKPKNEGETTFSAAIVKVLDGHWGQQISHTEIQSELKAAGYGEILERNPTYYYNLISKLVKKGMLTKAGRSHFNVSPGTPNPEASTNGTSAGTTA